MSDCIGELLREVRARMLADAGITAEVAARIYETVPAGVTFPLIALNNAQSEPDDTDTSSGMRHELTYSIHTKGEAARVDARRIGAAVIACLDRSGTTLTLTGHTCILLRFVRSIVFRADDATNGAAHGVYVFEAMTQQTAAASGA